jgi:hypothetical protein
VGRDSRDPSKESQCCSAPAVCPAGAVYQAEWILAPEEPAEVRVEKPLELWPVMHLSKCSSAYFQLVFFLGLQTP